MDIDEYGYLGKDIKQYKNMPRFGPLT